MKYCKDCSYYEEPQRCVHPNIISWAQLVVGPVDVRGIDAVHVRFQDILCGYSGKWFEARS